jgi:hypothetical protein
MLLCSCDLLILSSLVKCLYTSQNNCAQVNSLIEVSIGMDIGRGNVVEIRERD